ncbi:MAG TPA: PilZ domain-containing protein [Candidatus Acidoferrales bacterium]|nr:PilZ domain-containing protein [Candidatus Acidoferrales bacterium]
MAGLTYAAKRVNPRFPFFADAELTLRDGTWIPAQLSELSARGCYIDTLQPIAVGTELHLSICDGLSTCELPGKVIYKHSGGGLGVVGMGVVFGEVPAEQQPAIEGWLRHLAGNCTNSATPADSQTIA